MQAAGAAMQQRLGGVIATEPTGVAAPVLVRDGGPRCGEGAAVAGRFFALIGGLTCMAACCPTGATKSLVSLV